MLAYRLFIGRPHDVQTHESADQHEERRARQMKVGQQQLRRFETIAGRYENVGLSGHGVQAAIVRCGAFQRAQAGRADRRNAAARITRVV